MLRSAVRKAKTLIWGGARPDTKAKNLAHTINFPDFTLDICPSDYGGLMYNGREAYEENQSPLYSLIGQSLSPQYVFDVGANYGFSSLIFHRNFPAAHIYAIEPSPNLLHYLQANLSAIPDANISIINKVCGNEVSTQVQFGLNPTSSQDNRVLAQTGWISVPVPQTSIDEIAKQIPCLSTVFMKVDTQGFELQVFLGAEKTLARCSNWLVKTEFAPFCLLSQGTDPHVFLEYLLSNYSVYELPSRILFECDKLNHILSRPLSKERTVSFIKHVEDLNRGKTGWVDLIVKPKDGDG